MLNPGLAFMFPTLGLLEGTLDIGVHQLELGCCALVCLLKFGAHHLALHASCAGAARCCGDFLGRAALHPRHHWLELRQTVKAQVPQSLLPKLGTSALTRWPALARKGLRSTFLFHVP